MPALLFALAGSYAAASQTVEFVDREILVKFKGTPAVAANYAKMANAAIKAKTLNTISGIYVDRVQIPAGMTRDDALWHYSRLSTVEYCEPISKKEMYYTPNDPKMASQYGQIKVKCPEAWAITKGKTTVVVAVIDSGIDNNHEDLVGKIAPGQKDFSDNDNDATAAGDHGVHCAGNVAAATDNGKGVAGTGFNIKVLPLKIFPQATDANSAAAITYAADNGVKAISMSYGSGFESTTERNAVNYAWGKGVVLLASAGNAGNQVKNYPGAYTNCIGIGSTGVNDVRSGFSTYGPDWVDVGAPGENIESTVTGGYAEMSGTSMSCPMAAGVVGLLWSQAQPGTTAAQIRFALENTTDPIQNNPFKFGRVNALKAVQSLDPGSADLANPVAVSMWTGDTSTGTVGDLLATDGSFYTVTSSLSNLGQLGGAVVDLSFTVSPTPLREALCYVEANAPAGSTGQLYLWDFTANKYVLIKAFAVSPTGVKREKLPLPLNLTKYVSGGILRAGIRAIGPNRSPRPWDKGIFDFKLGFVQVGTRPVQ